MKKKNSTNYVFFVLYILFFVNVNGQSNIYTPKNLDSITLYLKKITTKQINTIEGEFKSKKKRVYKKNLEALSKQLKDSSFVFVPEISARLKEILKNVYIANPSINTKDFYFLINKSIFPNAATYGNGLFVVNLGLFDFLDSDDELAFIVCHELAHFINNDVHNGINNYINEINSGETKSKVRKIKKKRYGRSKAGMKLIKELNFDMFDYSRRAEMNADDLGFELYKKTKYKASASISTLKKLGALEDLVFETKIQFHDFFDFNEYSFKTKWLNQKQSLFTSSEEINDYKFDKDSLRSHPHAKGRVKNLFKKNVIDTISINDSNNNTISKLKTISHQVVAKTLFDSKRFDLLLYVLLSKIQNTQETEFDYNMVAQALQMIYKNKKNHSLGKNIPQINPFSNEKYLNEVKLFIHQTELGEIKKITYHFCKENKNKMSADIYNDIMKNYK